MFPDISDELIKTVVSNEFQKFASKHSDEWQALAADCAVQMLEEIRNILDEKIPLEQMHTKIMRIVSFMDTPPYPKRQKSSYTF